MSLGEADLALKGWEVALEKRLSTHRHSGGRDLADFCRGVTFWIFHGIGLKRNVVAGSAVSEVLARI